MTNKFNNEIERACITNFNDYNYLFFVIFSRTIFLNLITYFHKLFFITATF